jgi:hypothetical protein
MKSPGYVLNSQLISEIWNGISEDLIKNSFNVCGIHKGHRDHSNNISIRIDNLHSELKSLLINGKLPNSIVDDDNELAEAEFHMNNYDAFDVGFGELVMPYDAEDQMNKMNDRKRIDANLRERIRIC